MATLSMTPTPHTHPGWRRFLHWTPRVLSMLFIIFLSMFALDVFSGEYTFWETLGALFMHLIPSFILIAVVALAWRWQLVGAVAFGGFALWYLIWSWGMFDWTAPALISGIPLIVASLYLADWRVRRR
jgi:hypothetical protein